VQDILQNEKFKLDSDFSCSFIFDLIRVSNSFNLNEYGINCMIKFGCRCLKVALAVL
jgi:hypothetical protein